MNTLIELPSTLNLPQDPSGLPPQHARYLLPSATLHYGRRQGVSVVCQELPLNGFIIGYYIVETAVTSRLQAGFLPGFTSLHFLISGSLRTEQLLLQPDELLLSHYPAGKAASCDLTAGTLHLLSIHVPASFWLKLVAGNDCFADLAKAVQVPAPWLSGPHPQLPAIKGLLAQLLKELKARNPDLLALNGFCIQLTGAVIHLVTLQAKKKGWLTQKTIKIAELEQYISDHIGEPEPGLHPAALVKQLHMSRYQFNKVFQQVTGSSFAALVRKKRMEKAMELLTTTSMQVKQVWVAVGYNDFSVFCRAFKNYYGKPPGAFRNA